jgi:Predicted membrane protein
MSAAKKAAFCAVLAVFVASWILPRWPLEQALHSSLTLVGLAALWWADRRWPLGNGAYAAICVFIALHCLGARWLYSNVPYDGMDADLARLVAGRGVRLAAQPLRPSGPPALRRLLHPGAGPSGPASCGPRCVPVTPLPWR